MSSRSRFSFALAVSILMTASSFGQDAVLDWNNVLLDAVRVNQTGPPPASRAMAIVHTAIFDAVNAIEGGYEPYHYDAIADGDASVDAAVAAAAHRTLTTLFPNSVDAIDDAYDAALADIADGDAKDQGIAIGEAAADAILALRANDGASAMVVYEPTGEVGFWEPTLPGFAAAAAPQWQYVMPFGIMSGSQFRGDGPPMLDSEAYAADCNEVKEIGRADSPLRTADQTEIAEFWVNDPGTSTPPGHWNQIAQIAAELQGNTLIENARLFALMNIALADSAIVSWDNKYHYDHWRPVTAIQKADLDGNDATEIDPDWVPHIPTPPFPEYTSGHSTFSGAASKVLELFFGTDDIAFSSSSDGLPDTVRHYTSFSHAANESGRSRIYGGIHFEYSNQDGLRNGRDLAEYVFANNLKAVDDNPTPPTRLCGILGGGQLAMMFMGLLGLRLMPQSLRRKADQS